MVSRIEGGHLTGAECYVVILILEDTVNRLEELIKKVRDVPLLGGPGIPEEAYDRTATKLAFRNGHNQGYRKAYCELVGQGLDNAD